MSVSLDHLIGILAATLPATHWLYAKARSRPSVYWRIYRWLIVQARLRWANDQLRAQLKAAEADRDWWATMAKECAESRGMSVSDAGPIDVWAGIRLPQRSIPPRAFNEPSDESA